MRAPRLAVRTPLELWVVTTAELLARYGPSAAFWLVAEADGNRTRQAGDARLNGFEERCRPSGPVQSRLVRPTASTLTCIHAPTPASSSEPVRSRPAPFVRSNVRSTVRTSRLPIPQGCGVPGWACCLRLRCAQRWPDTLGCHSDRSVGSSAASVMAD